MLDNQDKTVARADALAAEMAEITREAMAPWRPGDSVKVALNRACRRLGISFRRARSFYYREAVTILAHEADRLRAWRRNHIEKEAERLEAELAHVRARQSALGGIIDDMALAGRAPHGSFRSIGDSRSMVRSAS